METTFQILEIILVVFKKHGIDNIRIANGLNNIKATTGSYLLKFDDSVELHTPYGVIHLYRSTSADEDSKIQTDIVSYLKGRFITVCNTFYLITHVKHSIQYTLVRTTLYSLEDVYHLLYKQPESWNVTRTFYDNEIKRLVITGWLTDDLYLLKELNEDQSIINYDRIIILLCKLNVTDTEDVIPFRSNLKQEKFIHILSLLLLANIAIYTH